MLAKGPHGELIVGNNSLDTKHIVIFDENLQYLRVIGGKGFGNGKFQHISGIAVNKLGFLYATDPKLSCIQKFNFNDGKFISQFGKRVIKMVNFMHPVGYCIQSQTCCLLLID